MNKGEVRMNTEKKAVIWQQWKLSRPISVIGRLVKKPPATIFSYLRCHGGIEPRPPKVVSRSLALNEREEICRGLAASKSIRFIARSLERSPTTIGREVSQNGSAARSRGVDADKAA